MSMVRTAWSSLCDFVATTAQIVNHKFVIGELRIQIEIITESGLCKVCLHTHRIDFLTSSPFNRRSRCSRRIGDIDYPRRERLPRWLEYETRHSTIRRQYSSGRWRSDCLQATRCQWIRERPQFSAACPIAGGEEKSGNGRRDECRIGASGTGVDIGCKQSSGPKQSTLPQLATVDPIVRRKEQRAVQIVKVCR